MKLKGKYFDLSADVARWIEAEAKRQRVPQRLLVETILRQSIPNPAWQPPQPKAK